MFIKSVAFSYCYNECFWAECQYSECHYADYCLAECHSVECHYAYFCADCCVPHFHTVNLSVIMLNIAKTNIIMLRVVKMNAVMLSSNNVSLRFLYCYTGCFYADC
jgi:hypothetical protein